MVSDAKRELSNSNSQGSSNTETTDDTLDEDLKYLEDHFRNSRKHPQHFPFHQTSDLSNNKVERVIEQCLMQDVRLGWLEESDNDYCFRSFVFDICKAQADDPYFVYAMTFMPNYLKEKYIFVCKRMPMGRDEHFCLDVGPLIEYHVKKLQLAASDDTPKIDYLELLITLNDILWLPPDQVLLIFSLDYHEGPYYFACVARLVTVAKTRGTDDSPLFGFIDLKMPFHQDKQTAGSKGKVDCMLESHIVELGFEDFGMFS